MPENAPVGVIRRLRKPLISTCIVAALLTQLLQNLAVGYLPVEPQASAPVRYGAWIVDQARWALGQLGWQTGLNAYWRMFSPVHKYDWWWAIEAVREDGSYELLPLPNQQARGPFEAQFVDFRESKMLLNMWNRADMREGYAQMLCRVYGAERPILRIRFALLWRDLLPPATAEQRAVHRGEGVQWATLQEVPCARR